MPSFEGNLLTSGTKLTHQKLETLGIIPWRPRVSIDLGLIRYRVVTPQTDGIPIANTRSVRTAVARNKNDNKMCLETQQNVQFIRPINQQQ